MKFYLKALGILIVILMIVLIPIFGTYVATAQSLPGEGRYPVKQQTEKVIDTVTSVNPNIYAYFSLLKAQRRYQEVVGLVKKDQDITESNQKFLDQIKQTLFDIQSVSDTSLRLNYIAQYQSFISSAKENLSYRADELKDPLGADKTKSIKTFAVESYGLDQGKLVAQKQILEQKNINQKDPVSNDLLIKNIEQLEYAQNTLESLIQK
jgi:hypothetical protein